uniref:NADH dehydrogenase subunit 6 n=1 Tax=Bargmannia lata TaxID=2078594 RepID=UPI0026E13F48|nr:NADH dehydrogenase subunit 6 [Bargmannia lata]WJJ70055.1 NADH dehydrogenase subunit 6 [Bargmannia lata]
MIQIVNLFFVLISFSTLMTIISLNPVQSVFWMVFVFFLSSGLLICLGLDFIPLIIITIYVGAITILFLFVIMMLDISKKISPLTNIPIIFFVSIFFFLELLLYKKNFNIINEWSFKNMSQIYIFKIIYNYYYPLILVSFLLLISMVGAIILTLELNLISRKQIIGKQQMRNNSWI